jgi:4-hydroxybenzoate polyprenyltransferase
MTSAIQVACFGTDGNRKLPLCVDLDGTLVKTDTLVEGVLSLVTTTKVFGLLPTLLSKGKAGLKDFVAANATFDPATLPYNTSVLAYIRQERTSGRTIVLVTAANIRIAQAVADYLPGVFNEVIASTETENLRGLKKAQALVKRFGEHGFCYMGDHITDLEVWVHSGACIPVHTTRATRNGLLQLGTPVETLLPDERINKVRAIAKALRPHQWVKNILAFVPLFTAGALTDAAGWLGSLLMFGAFCCTASSIYIVNDLTDIKADRQHPRKRNRPFAKGTLDPLTGLGIAGILLLTGLALSAAGHVLPIIALYAVISISYSARLKEVSLIDVFILAGLYTIRLAGGGIASGHHLSFWLLGFSGFMFLSLAIMKRVQECSDAVKAQRTALRRGYTAADLGVLQTIGIGSSFASSVVLALYVQSEVMTGLYRSPWLLWGIVPILLFWQCRLWLATARGDMHDDPIVYAARDRMSWLVAVLAFLCLLLARAATYHIH